jgi:hypothetical protein
MFPPGEVEKMFGAEYDEVKLRISFLIQEGQIVMRFSDQVKWVRMTSGARKLAVMLNEKAVELDRVENVPAPASTRVRSKPPVSHIKRALT